jgi:hypothetical protein
LSQAAIVRPPERVRAGIGTPTRAPPTSKKWIVCLIVALQVFIPAFAETVYFHIVAQPMPAALALFAEQSHMQVLYDYEAVASVRCKAVIGEMGKREALERLLLDTGLEAAFSSPTAVTVRRVRAPLVQPAPSPPQVPGH